MRGHRLPRFALEARSGRLVSYVFYGVLGFTALGPVAVGVGQIQQSPAPPRSQLPGDASGEPHDPFGPQNASKLAHMREDERRKRLLADTAKLVALTNELKTDVEKSTKDELSLDVVRKAAEIEKLAKDVKDRMKG